MDSGRIWLVGTADVPDEFAPLLAQWHIARQMKAGNTGQ